MRLLPYFLLPIFALSAQDSPDSFGIGFESLPSTYVKGVNVITGDYHHFKEDANLKGVASFPLQRTYHSKAEEDGSLCYTWDLRHEESFFLPTKENKYLSYLKNDCGGVIFFKRENDDKPYEFDIIKNYKGLTNCGSGILSGCTNPKNLWARIHRKQRTATVHDGAGNKTVFEALSSSGEQIKAHKEIRINGHQAEYSYNAKHKLETITLKSKKHKTLGQLSFEYPSKKEMKVTLDGNRTIRYHFKKKNRDCPETNLDFKYTYLSKVEGDGIPTTRYHYKNPRQGLSEKKLTKIDVEGGYFLEINYFNKQTYYLGGRPCTIDSYDKRYQRVYQLIEPADGNLPATTTTFDYDVPNRCTAVYDAYGHCTRYFYNGLHQITDIERCGDDGEVFKESFTYTVAGGFYHGNLISRSLHSPKGELVAQKDYVYDERGNVLCETLTGPLTGAESHESDSIEYEYSNDKRNLLRKEIHAEKTVTYSYVHDTNLLRYKATSQNGQVLGRELYSYDDTGALEKKIVDNGSGWLESDWTDVTERHIFTFENKPTAPHAGLPLIEREWAWDFERGEAVLLHEKQIKYDPQGSKIEEKLYDGEHNFLYTLRWKYDNAGRPIEEHNALGQVIRRTYNARGQITLEEGPTPGYSVQYFYNHMGHCYSKNEYGNENLFSEETESSPTMALFRHPARKKRTSHQPTRSTKYRYNPASQCTSEKDRFNQVQKYEYEARGYLKSKTTPTGSCTHPETRELSFYDAQGNRTTYIDPEGHSTTTTYTARGQPLIITYPDGAEERYTYQLDGHLRSHTDRKGLTRLYTYDALDHLTELTFVGRDGEQRTQTAEYDYFHLLKEVDEDGIETHYRYDFAGRLSEKTRGPQRITYAYDSLGRCTHTYNWLDDTRFLLDARQYDLLGRVIAEWQEDENGTLSNRTEYLYNERGDVTDLFEETDHGFSHKQFTYNSFGDLLREVDSHGIETLFLRETIPDPNHPDAFLEKVTRVDPEGVQTATTFDPQGQVMEKEVISPFGVTVQRQTMAYNRLGQLIRVSAHLEEGKPLLTEYRYNLQGVWTKKIEAKGTIHHRITTRTLNDFGEVEEEQKPNTLLFYQYNGFGQVSQLLSADNTVHYVYEYDNKDRIIRVQDIIQQTDVTRRYGIQGQLEEEQGVHGEVTQYRYDALDRLQRIVLPDKTGWEVTYAGKQLTAVCRFDAANKERYRHEVLSYDPQGRPKKERLPCQEGLTNYEYDPNGRITAIHHPQWSEQAAYDGNGNLLSSNDNQYAYDALNQLTGEPDHTYRYDTLQNRIEKDGHSCTFNALNQLTEDDAYHYTYDPNGNLLERQGLDPLHCSYDALGRLTSVDTPDGFCHYTYDPFHRRVGKMTPDGTNETYWHIDELEVATLTDGTLTQLRMVHPNETPLAYELDGQLLVPLHNVARQIVAVLDAEGNAVNTYQWSAFGEIRSMEERTPLPWKWGGKRVDPETGWVVYGRRYYDPATARWTTCDPLDTLDGPNLYTYLKNNPLVHFDRLGLYTETFLFEEDRFLYRNYKPLYSPPPTFSYSSSEFTIMAPPLFAEPVRYPSMCFDLDFESRCPIKNDSRVINLDLKEDPRLAVGLTNGMCNSKQDCLGHMNYISRMMGGYNVRGVYNASHGPWRDFDEVLRGRTGVCTEPVALIHKMWDSYFHKAPEDGIFLHFCHSQGAIHTKNALLSYPPELRSRIYVIAIAPGGYILEETCGSVSHYRASFLRDPIPRFTFSFAGVNLDSIVTLKSHPNAPWHDHSFQSPTYQYPIDQAINSYAHLWK